MFLISDALDSGEDMLSALLLIFVVIAIASFCFCAGNMTGCIANWKLKLFDRGATRAAHLLASEPGLLGVYAVGLDKSTDVELGNEKDTKSKFWLGA
jgi:hypothetical protein